MFLEMRRTGRRGRPSIEGQRKPGQTASWPGSYNKQDSFGRVSRISDSANVVGSFSLLFNFDLELHRIPLKKHLSKSSILNVAFVEENIFSLFRGDESKSFCCVEKLHDPLIHTNPFFSSKTKNPSQQSYRLGSEYYSLVIPS